jgi:membrane protease YdiL (CAAX protease family)
MVKRSHVILYVLLVALFSLPWYLLVIHTQELGMAGGTVVRMLMWSPALAALLTCRLGGLSFTSLGWRWPKMRYVGLGYGLPILYAALAYFPYWAFVRGSFNLAGYATAKAAQSHLHNPSAAVLVNLFLLLTAGMIGSVANGLGEEIGWRGFLFPSLLRLHGTAIAIFVSGAIWALWHYPLIIGANYNSGGPAWLALLCFTWMVLAGAAIFGWLRVKSGSVWPAAIAHGSHNLFIQAICDPITRQDQRASIWTTEFGILLALTTTIFALVCWLKYPPRAQEREVFATRDELVAAKTMA